MKAKEDVKMTLKLAAVLAALASISLSARAGQSEALIQGDAAFAQALGSIMIPLTPKDAFAGVDACGVLDVKPFRAYFLQEAVDLLQPCLDGVSARYGVGLAAKAGAVEAASIGGSAVPGIQIKVSGRLPTGNSALMDLYRGLNLRNQHLLGFRVLVLREGQPEPAFRSPVQNAVDHCLLPMVVRKIENSSDFVRIYGRCITNDSALKVKAIRPAAGSDLGVTLLSDAPQADVQALNGSVVVNSGTGPVTITVVAYPNEIVLP